MLATSSTTSSTFATLVLLESLAHTAPTFAKSAQKTPSLSPPPRPAPAAESTSGHWRIPRPKHTATVCLGLAASRALPAPTPATAPAVCLRLTSTSLAPPAPISKPHRLKATPSSTAIAFLVTAGITGLFTHSPARFVSMANTARATLSPRADSVDSELSQTPRRALQALTRVSVMQS